MTENNQSVISAWPGKVLGFVRQHKVLAGIISGVVLLAIVYFGLVITVNNQLHALLSDWDKGRNEYLEQDTALGEELEVLFGKWEKAIFSEDGLDPASAKQGTIDSRTLDKKLEAFESEFDQEQKSVIAKIESTQKSSLYRLLTKRQKVLVATLPPALTDELSTDQSRKENLALASYLVNFFDLIDASTAYIAASDEEDPAKSLALAGPLQKFAQSDALYREEAVKEILPVTHKSLKAGLIAFGQYYQAIEITTKPDYSNADYKKALELATESDKNLTLSANAEEDSYKEIFVLLRKDLSKSDSRIFTFVSSYLKEKLHWFSTSKPTLSIARETVLDIEHGITEYQNNTANLPLNPDDLKGLIATIKGKGIVTWLPDEPADIKLIKRNGKAYLQFKLSGREQERMILRLDDKNPTQIT